MLKTLQSTKLAKSRKGRFEIGANGMDKVNSKNKINDRDMFDDRDKINIRDEVGDNQVDNIEITKKKNHQKMFKSKKTINSIVLGFFTSGNKLAFNKLK